MKALRFLFAAVSESKRRIHLFSFGPYNNTYNITCSGCVQGKSPNFFPNQGQGRFFEPVWPDCGNSLARGDLLQHIFHGSQMQHVFSEVFFRRPFFVLFRFQTSRYYTECALRHLQHAPVGHSPCWLDPLTGSSAHVEHCRRVSGSRVSGGESLWHHSGQSRRIVVGMRPCQ